MNRRFTKNLEDFVCEKCGAHVIGNGFTNHCPECLWSKHVDNNPGDRAAICKGMMEPKAIEGSSPSYRILHECLLCGHTKRNAITPNDSITAILKIAKGRV